ncbi:MAG: protein kinase [Acidobacteria bacterium]|nr:protein kinase [Acidobacteriota bacterium]
MSLTAGTKLGPYEIQSPLAAGGMGEVYKARDTRLDRTVAIKILPSHLSENPEAKQRFDREARTISSLNHPNICTLHDVGEQGDVGYLVMEFLEGETLAERLRKGPLPVDQVLKNGIEICEGLEKAHRSGVVHRDLKPGNIMLTKMGAKLMDFGLAKASQAGATATSGLTATLTTPPGGHPLTAQGVVVGTFQYMSPEQVEGQEADARSDIFALGAVLYEMATGKRAFEGKTVASAMAAVLERDPAPIFSLQPMAPAALDSTVKTCLDKDPDERWQTAHDVKLQLRQITVGRLQPGVIGSTTVGLAAAPRKQNRPYLRWAAIALIAAAAAAAGYFAHVSHPAPPVWGGLNVTGELGEEGSFVLSSDGRQLAYVAADPQGRLLIWVRKLDSPRGLQLEGTSGAEYPFWSADGRSVGFFADGKLKRIEADGQNLQTVRDAPNGRGGTWNRDGLIVFTPNAVGGIAKVSAAGGTAVPITQTGESMNHRFPHFLPDGHHFLFTQAYGKRGQDGIYMGSTESPEFKLISAGASSNAAYASGYLLLVRDGKLLAQPFDSRRLQLTGAPSLVSDGVRTAFDRRVADFSVAQNGTLVFLSAMAGGQRLVWFDREGKELGVAVPDIGNPTSGLLVGTLSPSGERVAVARSRGTGSDIWMYSLQTALGTRLTFTDDFNESPVWSPDSNNIVFTRNLTDHYELRLKSVFGASEERMLVKSTGNTLATAWSRDRRFIFYAGDVFGANGKAQGVVLDMEGGSHKAMVATPSQGNVFGGSFSPDTKWVAYLSDETGRLEVYVTSFPNHLGKWQLSTGGADGALGTIWTGTGPQTEVVFRDLQSHLISVPVREQGGSLSPGAPRVLLGGRSLASSRFTDLTRDGKRILAGLPQENASTPLTLLLNWTKNLKR